jgi:hypothetical protein
MNLKFDGGGTRFKKICDFKSKIFYVFTRICEL